jgi:hypothetical protein
MQDLLGSYVWDWADLRAQLPGFAAAHLPSPADDLVGPGLAIDEAAPHLTASARLPPSTHSANTRGSESTRRT